MAGSGSQLAECTRARAAAVPKSWPKQSGQGPAGARHSSAAGAGRAVAGRTTAFVSFPASAIVSHVDSLRTARTVACSVRRVRCRRRGGWHPERSAVSVQAVPLRRFSRAVFMAMPCCSGGLGRQWHGEKTRRKKERLARPRSGEGAAAALRTENEAGGTAQA